MSVTGLRQLRDAVRQLQNDAKDQLYLEYESQATFEHHNSQIGALRQAFGTLSDVVMGELDAIRACVAGTTQSADELIGQCSMDVRALKSRLSATTDALEAWSVKERGWAKDTELLKVSHAHLADWMQQVQRDVAILRDEAQSEKQRAASHVSEVFGEMRALQCAWDHRVRSIVETCRGTEVIVEGHTKELDDQKRQRVNDLELLEKAITTVQQQQMRLRASIDGELRALPATPCPGGRADALESAISACQVDARELRRAFAVQERDTKRHFDNIARVLNVMYGTPRSPLGLQVDSENGRGTTIRN